MRIIAGEFKGRKLITPRGLHIRPTADRVKQYIFDVLADQVVNAMVLDLFSGTGNLGIEALSRGAAHVCFVEQNRNAVRLIKQNIELLHLEHRNTVVQKDALSFLRHSDDPSYEFDVIFADPPYKWEKIDELILLLAEKKRLRTDGCFVLEHPTTQKFDRTYLGLCVKRVRKLGNTSISMFMNDTINEA